jgi:DNA-binding beta-propeller fold protein YncE
MKTARRNIVVLCLAALILICGVSLAGFAIAAPQAAGGSGYHLAKKVTLGGEGGWDYLFADAATHRIFISRGTHTMVTDADGKLLGDIPNTQGVHGIALAPEFNRGFTSNGRANTVTIFELDTLKTISEVKVSGENPDSILYDTATKRIFTFNGRTGNSTALDAKTGEVVGTIALGGKPETPQSDGAGHIYANIEDKSEIVDIDSAALKVLNTWSIAPCEEPSGLAFDVAHHRLFAGCGNKMMAVVDSTNGKVLNTLPIGDGVDADAFDPQTGFAFASCGDGTLTVVHEDSPDKFSVADTVQTQRGARTMTVDTGSHNVYTVTADFGPTPTPTADHPRQRPPMIPNTFTLLIFTR